MNPQPNQRAAGDKPAAVSAPKKVRRVTRMRAMQALQHNNRLVHEGEVFDYVDCAGDKLPSDEIMTRCDADVGPPPEPEPVTAPPSWTTKGFVEKAHREAGAAT